MRAVPKTVPYDVRHEKPEAVQPDRTARACRSQHSTAQTTRTVVRVVFAGQLAVQQRLKGLTLDNMLCFELSSIEV